MKNADNVTRSNRYQITISLATDLLTDGLCNGVGGVERHESKILQRKHILHKLSRPEIIFPQTTPVSSGPQILQVSPQECLVLLVQNLCMF